VLLAHAAGQGAEQASGGRQRHQASHGRPALGEGQRFADSRHPIQQLQAPSLDSAAGMLVSGIESSMVMSHGHKASGRRV
jgi:hypothetical protein